MQQYGKHYRYAQECFYNLKSLPVDMMSVSFVDVDANRETFRVFSNTMVHFLEDLSARRSDLNINPIDAPRE